MNRLLFLALLLLPAGALAGPFIVTDPVDARVTHCGVVMDGAAKLVIAVTAEGANKICKHDIQGLPAGSHTVTMTAMIVNDPIWGDEESAPSAPLTFVRPSSPSVPAGLRLTP